MPWGGDKPAMLIPRARSWAAVTVEAKQNTKGSWLLGVLGDSRLEPGDLCIRGGQFEMLIQSNPEENILLAKKLN